MRGRKVTVEAEEGGVAGDSEEVSSEKVNGSCVSVACAKSVTNGGLNVDGWSVGAEDGLVGKLWRAVERSVVNIATGLEVTVLS